ncbi:DoxX family protein [Robiginitalea sp.]|uniref:DoxX family protein n=1 Tax=Robiginitalea sp. TaxID=1902411 RepID=UPI003C710CFB
MEDLVMAAKIILFVSIVNVWFFRANRGTQWRAGDSKNMKEEFKIYGLSETMMYSVGFLKVLSAIGLIVSIWFPVLAIPASAAMGFLMVGAIWMHLKVKDPLKKALPAFLFLLLSAFIWLYSTGLI